MKNMKKKILVCDDEKAINRALQLKLIYEGFDVVTVLNGDECLSAMAKETFDLVLLDLVLPQKDGFAVLEKLKELGNKVPIVIISNLGQEEDIERVKYLGVTQYLIKSNTSIMDMVNKVKEVLNIGI